jgi:hypothetical protein
MSVSVVEQVTQLLQNQQFKSIKPTQDLSTSVREIVIAMSNDNGYAFKIRTPDELSDFFIVYDTIVESVPIRVI